MIWERRDDWWATEVFGVRPAPKRVIYMWGGTAETKAMKMSSHELDGVWQLLPSVIDSIRKTSPTVRSWSLTPPYGFPGLCPRHLYLNMLKYPWNMVEVRRAVSYLLDRKKYAMICAEGGVDTAWGPFPLYGGFKPYFEAIQDLISKYEPTAYNVTKAEEIFRSLGFTKGTDGIWVTPNGTRLELTIPVPNWSPEMFATGPAIADDLRVGGIDATIKPMDSTPFTELQATGNYDGIFTWLCPGDSDPLSNLDLFHSKYYAPLGEYASGDYMRYKNPEYDAIVDELRQTSPEDLEKCIELFRRAIEIYFRDVISIPIIHAADGMAVFDYYYWIGWPNAENPYVQPWPHIGTFLLAIAGYPSPLAGGEWVKGIRPSHVEYTIVYFTQDTQKFRGIDLTWYGPFKNGDAAKIPIDDAEFWIRKGHASYTPPLPTALIESMAADISDLKTKVADLITKEELATVTAQINTLTIVVVIEAIVAVILAAALLMAIRK